MITTDNALMHVDPTFTWRLRPVALGIGIVVTSQPYPPIAYLNYLTLSPCLKLDQ